MTNRYEEELQIYQETMGKILDDLSKEEWEFIPPDSRETLWNQAEQEVRESKHEKPPIGSFWRANNSAKSTVQIIDYDTYVDLEHNSGMPFKPTTADKFDNFVHSRQNTAVYFLSVEDKTVSYMARENLGPFYENCTQITDESEIGILLLKVQDD